jgi:predicted MFS family arabinose efflux permease
MAGGGLALMVVPPLTEATGWRAAYWSAAVLALVAFHARRTRPPQVSHTGAWVHAAPPSSWRAQAATPDSRSSPELVVPLLEREV